MSILLVVTIVTSAVAIASLIAATTPTPKDNHWSAKFYKVIDVVALNVGKAKETGAVIIKAAAKPRKTAAKK